MTTMMFQRLSFLCLLGVCLSALFTCSASTVPDTKNAWKEVVEGVLDGAFGETEEIAIECFEEGEIMIDDLEQAVQDIQEGTEKSVKEGIELIGQAISAAAQDLKDCEEVVENVEDLINMAAMLAHPMSFVYHAGKNIIVNHVEIAKEVESATQAWESDPKEYYQFGFNVGEILEQIFFESDLVSIALV